MRKIDEIVKTRNDVVSSAQGRQHQNITQMALDMNGLLHALEDRDADIEALRAEIARLKADLAQVRVAITKLSREIWKVC